MIHAKISLKMRHAAAVRIYLLALAVAQQFVNHFLLSGILLLRDKTYNHEHSLN